MIKLPASNVPVPLPVLHLEHQYPFRISVIYKGKVRSSGFPHWMRPRPNLALIHRGPLAAGRLSQDLQDRIEVDRGARQVEGA